MNRTAAHDRQARVAADASAAVGAPAAAESEAPTLPAAIADTLGDLVDGVAALDSMLATVTAMRAELIDQAAIERSDRARIRSFG